MNWAPDSSTAAFIAKARSGYMDPARAAEVLGVLEDAPKSQIRGRYAKLVMANHPDRGGDGAQLELLQAARDCLLSSDLTCGHGGMRTCPMCNGRGSVAVRFESSKCTTCQGTGEVK